MNAARRADVLAICAALQWEVRGALLALDRVRRSAAGPVKLWQGSSGTEPVLVFRTGMGATRAEESARAVLDRFPVSVLINTGCAGALAPELEPGALVIPHRVLDGREGNAYESDPEWSARLRRAAAQAALATFPGSLLTSPDILHSADEKRAARQRCGATAVDMEGAALAALAAARSLPFACARAILDTAVLEIPLGSFVDANGSVRPLKAALHAVRHPSEIPVWMEIARHARTAESALRALFRAVLRNSAPQT